MKGKKMTGRLRDRLFPEGSWIRVKLRIINRIVKTLFNVNYMKKQFINIKQQGFKKTIKEIKSDSTIIRFDDRDIVSKDKDKEIINILTAINGLDPIGIKEIRNLILSPKLVLLFLCIILQLIFFKN